MTTVVPREGASTGTPAWRPRFGAFGVTFLLFAALGVWACLGDTDTGPTGWYTSVVWTLPAITAIPGLVGACLAARRLRTPPSGRTAPVEVADLLVVVVPSVGRRDTYPALERAISSFCRHMPRRFPDFRVDVVLEEACEAAEEIAALAATGLPLRVLTVPRGYRPPNGSRFKARANHYAHVVRLAEGEARDDVWVLHMDDDTGVGPDTVDSIADFIGRQRHEGADRRHLAQGVLSFPRECAGSRLVWLADAIRPGCDISIFFASTGRGSPRCGLHGELLLIRASVEATIGWDFGPTCIVEDAYFATEFCARYPGRSGWFAGRSYGASPMTVRDFLRQRERWVWGLLELVTRSSVPWRRRAPLAKNVAVWACAPLQHPGVVLLGALAVSDLDTTPVSVLLVPLWSLNMGYCVWLYWEGFRVNVLASADRRSRWWEPLALVLLIPLFALWEVVGTLRGLLRFARRSEHDFDVIAKPR